MEQNHKQIGGLTQNRKLTQQEIQQIRKTFGDDQTLTVQKFFQLVQQQQESEQIQIYAKTKSLQLLLELQKKLLLLKYSKKCQTKNLQFSINQTLQFYLEKISHINFQSLKSLFLENSKILNIQSLTYLIDCPNLKKLSIVGNKITSLKSFKRTKLKYLNWLHIAVNPINDIYPLTRMKLDSSNEIDFWFDGQKNKNQFQIFKFQYKFIKDFSQNITQQLKQQLSQPIQLYQGKLTRMFIKRFL